MQFGSALHVLLMTTADFCPYVQLQESPWLCFHSEAPVVVDLDILSRKKILSYLF